LAGAGALGAIGAVVVVVLVVVPVLLPCRRACRFSLRAPLLFETYFRVGAGATYGSGGGAGV